MLVTATQGTVWEFDGDRRQGRVVLDDGSTLSFSSAVFAASKLRLLRPGQRVRFELDDDATITSLTILTLPHPD